jgi:hypothetical protein
MPTLPHMKALKVNYQQKDRILSIPKKREKYILFIFLFFPKKAPNYYIGLFILFKVLIFTKNVCLIMDS